MWVINTILEITNLWLVVGGGFWAASPVSWLLTLGLVAGGGREQWNITYSLSSSGTPPARTRGTSEEFCFSNILFLFFHRSPSNVNKKSNWIKFVFITILKIIKTIFIVPTFGAQFLHKIVHRPVSSTMVQKSNTIWRNWEPKLMYSRWEIVNNPSICWQICRAVCSK